MYDLAGVGLGEPQLTGHSVDAVGAAELSFAKAELAILFAELIANLLLGLDVIRGLNGIEVLETVDHNEREEHSASGGEDAHLACTNWIGGFHESGIVEAMREEDLRCADSATTHGLLR